MVVAAAAAGDDGDDGDDKGSSWECPQCTGPSALHLAFISSFSHRHYMSQVSSAPFHR